MSTSHAKMENEDSIHLQLENGDNGGGSAQKSDSAEGDKPIREVLANGWGPYLKESLTEVFLGSKLNILLLFVPLAFAARYLEWDMVSREQSGVYLCVHSFVL